MSDRSGFDRLPEKVRATLRPSLRIRTTVTPIEQLELGQSRMGGLPDLPQGFEWPHYKGLPLAFIAQLNLTDLHSEPTVLQLPEKGSLVFFYDSEQRTWGFDPKDKGSAVIAYIPDSGPALVRTPVPAGMPDSGCFDACTLGYDLEETLPDPFSELFEPKLSDAERDLLFDYRERVEDSSGGPRHRLGGHADCVQNPMELECQLVTNGLYCGDPSGYNDPRSKLLARGAGMWKLLLQIDTDDSASMMWGDCGTIYYWIKDEDLRNGLFDRAWLILQCA